MKRSTTVLLMFVVASCSAGVRDELAKTKTESIWSWSGIRDAILAIGPSATNELARVAGDENLDWRERFMAGVCLERLIQPDARNAFFANPLKDDTERDPGWIPTAAGYAHEEVPLFEKRIKETGFWFAALEVYSLMVSDESFHPLWKTAESALFKLAPNHIRAFAARISEVYAQIYYAGRNDNVAGYADWLMQYVLDGIYPDGSYTLLRRMPDRSYFRHSELIKLLAINRDPGFLISILDRFPPDSQAARLVSERIAELRNLTESASHAVPTTDEYLPQTASASEPIDSRVKRGDDVEPDTEEPPASESWQDNKQQPGFPWVLGGIVLATVLAVILFRFRRLLSDSGRNGRCFLLLIPFVLLLACATTASAGVMDELAKTKTESIRSWSGIRDAILAIGPSATNELARAAADEGLDWRERFMANVCLERLVNGQRRDDFFRNPFRGDPERDLSWIVMATGYAREEIPLVEKRLSENGFWFGVLEAFAHMDTDPCAFDSVFKAAFSIVDESAPLYIRKTAAQISEEFARRFVDGIDEYAGTYVTALKRYILDGTHVGGVATYLRFLASQKHCSFVELEDMVALTSDIALLESLIPCFSSRPEHVSMIQRRIEHLRESMVVDEDPQPAPVLDSGRAEREEVSAPVGEEVVGTSPYSNDGTHSRPSWLFAGGVVLFVIVLAILVRFRRLFPDSVGHRRNLVLFAGVALSLTCATTGSAGVMDELARTRMEPIRSWSGIRD